MGHHHYDHHAAPISMRKCVLTLRHHREMFKLCASIGDFSYFGHHMAALAATNFDGPFASDDEMFAPLCTVAEEANQKNGDIGTESANYLDSNKKDIQTKDGWMTVLNRRREEDKKKADEAIDAAYDAAEEKLGELPEEARDQGMNLFLKGMDAAAMCWGAIVETFEKLFEKIVDFLKKVWDGIKDAAVQVVNHVKTAAKLIRSWFGF